MLLQEVIGSGLIDGVLQAEFAVCWRWATEEERLTLPAGHFFLSLPPSLSSILSVYLFKWTCCTQLACSHIGIEHLSSLWQQVTAFPSIRRVDAKDYSATVGIG